MTQAKIIREGRYTGPSLQVETAQKRQHKNDFVPVPAPVKLDKNRQAIIDLHIAGGIVARGAWRNDNSAPAYVLAWFTAHPRALRCVALV